MTILTSLKTGHLKKYDTLATGIIAGVLLPITVYFIMYYSKIQDIRFTLFSNHLLIGNIIPVILSHCVLPNLLLFLVFSGLDWLRAAKGTLAITVVLTLVLFSIKLIFRFV
jgi:hypothetical protein